MQSKRIKFSNALAIAMATLCLLSVTSLWAQSGKNFYEGKTITFFAGSSAGGGTDLTARLIAKHLERYIPGKPAVLVVNKPGAGGMIAVNELYNVKKPDGLTMSTMNTGALFGLATGNDALKFDLQKFIWVGQALDEAQTVYVRSATPYTSFDAIRKANKEGKQPKMGAQSLDHTSNVVVKIVEQILGLGFPSDPRLSRDAADFTRYRTRRSRRPVPRHGLAFGHSKRVDRKTIYPASRYIEEQTRLARARGADYRRVGPSGKEESAERVICS